MTTDPIHRGLAPAQSALPDDQHDLAANDLEKRVARFCSAYGTVVKVVVHVSDANRNIRAFALVDMSKPAEAERLATALGRRTVGTAVVLLLGPSAVSSLQEPP